MTYIDLGLRPRGVFGVRRSVEPSESELAQAGDSHKYSQMQALETLLNLLNAARLLVFDAKLINKNSKASFNRSCIGVKVT
jgi:hypothetical protein